MKMFKRFIYSTSAVFLLMSATPADSNKSGTILETMDAANYTYIKLKTDSGEIWAAVPQTQVKVGDKATVLNPQTMDNFESKTLKRKFDHILFGTLKEASITEAKEHHQNMPTEAVDISKIKVEKAKGATGKTIAEIYALKSQLKNKDVLVHGKVTKFLPGIMKRNWVHISDGTGSTDKKDFDLTATTQDEVKVGDTVTFKGKLHADVDFGAGYFFQVVMEEAKVTKD